MYQNILIATDGSSLAARAVDHGVKLAEALGAKVVLLTVTEPFHVFAVDPEQLEETPTSYRKQAEKHAERTLAEAAEIAALARVEATGIQLEDSTPYQAIIRTAETSRCDVIVMASHGRGGVSALLLGSETMKVLSHSKIPVLVVR